jgi:hypothetical protein
MSNHKIIKFEYPQKPMSFSEREKLKNEKILSTMNSFRGDGIISSGYQVVNNNSSFFVVKFEF